MIKRILAVLALLYSANLCAAYTESQKIDMLVNAVRTYNGAIFIRNGENYSAKDAADHLQMKRKKAGSRVKTARDFIDKIASKSYMSGKDYFIRKPDGSLVKSSDFLNKALSEIEK